MPREGVPQNEFVWFHAKPEECAPHNRRSRLGKTVRAVCSFARAARLDIGKEVARFYLNSLASPQQQSLRSHRDSGEMTATISKCFTDDCEFHLAQPFLQICA